MEDAKQKPTNKPKSVYKDAASCYCKDIANLNPLPKEEEVRLSNDIKKGEKVMLYVKGRARRLDKRG